MSNRVLKDSIKRSSEIDSLTWFQEVMFYRLITTVDDNGCYHANPQILKSDLFPMKDDITKASISEALNKLESVGLIKQYESDGKKYLMLTTWSEHQRIRNKTHHFPLPPWMTDASCGDSRRVAADCSNNKSNEKDVAADCSSNEKVVAASRGESRRNAALIQESKNPRIQEGEEESKKTPPHPLAEDDDLIAVQKDHNQILDEADAIGLPSTDWNRSELIRLYAEYGLDAVTHGIRESGRLNKVSIAYIETVAKNYGHDRDEKAGRMTKEETEAMFANVIF